MGGQEVAGRWVFDGGPPWKGCRCSQLLLWRTRRVPGGAPVVDTEPPHLQWKSFTLTFVAEIKAASPPRTLLLTFEADAAEPLSLQVIQSSAAFSFSASERTQTGCFEAASASLPAEAPCFEYFMAAASRVAFSEASASVSREKRREKTNQRPPFALLQHRTRRESLFDSRFFFFPVLKGNAELASWEELR